MRLEALSPTWFEATSEVRAVVLIAPAMAVRQDYYTRFAEFLATQGFKVATFDYRQSGFNAPASMKGVTLTFDDWTDDLDQMIETCKQAANGKPLIVVGHSLGGQLLGFAKNNTLVDAVFTTASGTGYWRHNHHQPLRLFYLWFVAMPLFTRLFGYFPGRRLRKIGDLSKPMALTWSRWCRHPDYYVDERGKKLPNRFGVPSFPLVAWSFDDDDYIPKPACDQLHALFVSAGTQRKHFRPTDLGTSRIGHFGFYKLGGQSQAWLQALTTINGFVPA
jgi:predicted alpha/beta hydrolase